eukprot:TRINITY_DN3599_c0_g3_i3.p1 TRINITY_DN3599_c0_g3~~TRINITY_DN3599_c0_g3_i3.p1  ORF type:complete len:276 (+),score=119.30 TRINITY_DN3599_c0_g3_i3:156-983(+)
MNEQLKIHVVSTETATDAKGQFTVYVIRVKTNKEEFHVRRRYNQFYEFKSLIESKYPVTSSARGVFPPKKWFFNMSADTINTRKNSFENYLQQIVTLSPDLLSSAEFLHFISDERKKLVSDSSTSIAIVTPTNTPISSSQTPKSPTVVVQIKATPTSTPTPPQQQKTTTTNTTNTNKGAAYVSPQPPKTSAATTKAPTTPSTPKPSASPAPPKTAATTTTTPSYTSPQQQQQQQQTKTTTTTPSYVSPQQAKPSATTTKPTTSFAPTPRENISWI